MTDYRNTVITGIIGLIGPDVIENGALERRKYDEEAMRGRLAHYTVSRSQQKRLKELIQEIVAEEEVSFNQGRNSYAFLIFKNKKIRKTK